VSFAINLQLTQASEANQEGRIVLQVNDIEGVWPGNESGNKNLSGNIEGNCLLYWQDQYNEDNNIKHTIMLVSSKKDGVFTKHVLN